MNDFTGRLLAFIKIWEGVQFRVYKDTANLLTVGVGHLVLPEDNLKLGDVITTEQVDAFLAKDIQTALSAVNRLVRVPLSDQMRIALVSFVFNLGEGNFKRSKLLAVLNGGNYEAAANEFGKWIKSGGKVTQGLVNRRAAEKKLFLSDPPG